MSTTVLKHFAQRAVCLGLFFFAIVPPLDAQIQVVPDWSVDQTAGTGFFDPVLGEKRREVFIAAANYFGSLFAPSYPGETIRVKASFTQLATNVLGTGGSVGFLSSDNFTSTSSQFFPHTEYPFALADHLGKTNLTSGDQIEVNFSDSAAANWSYSTNSTPDLGTGMESLFATMIHEIAHGAGFVDSIDPTTGALADPQPNIFDHFIVKGKTEKTPLTTMSDADRLAAITSNDLYWNGALATAANGGNLIKLYAPSPYEQGSSVAHLDAATFDPLGLLLLPRDSNLVKAELGLSGIEQAMYFDMGYTQLRSQATLAAEKISSITRDGNVNTVRFSTRAGASYRLRYSADVHAPPSAWTASANTVKGDGSVQTLTDISTDTQRFYSVETTP